MTKELKGKTMFQVKKGLVDPRNETKVEQPKKQKVVQPITKTKTKTKTIKEHKSLVVFTTKISSSANDKLNTLKAIKQYNSKSECIENMIFGLYEDNKRVVKEYEHLKNKMSF